MSFINFESAKEKERIRQELRDARENLLRKAEFNAKRRDEFEIQKKLRGEDQWMLPSVSEKIDKLGKLSSDSRKSKHKKKHKKEKKSKKDKKERRRKHKRTSSDDESSSSSEEIILKKSRKKHYSSNDEETSDEGEWVEKKSQSDIVENNKQIERDDWMSGMLIPTYSKEELLKLKNPKNDKNSYETYNPAQNARELNPHWKNGGTGLPQFKKPSNDSDDEIDRNRSLLITSNSSRGNWRKRPTTPETEPSSSNRHSRREDRRKSSSSSETDSDLEPKNSKLSMVEENVDTPTMSDFLTDQQMNELGAKLIKAEIMGNEKLAIELKERLDKARAHRSSYKIELKNKKEVATAQNMEEEHVLLTTTDSKGFSRPLQGRDKQPDPWGGRKKSKGKKVETHTGHDRVRYFADDDKYNLKEMFQAEKMTTSSDSDAQFAKIAAKHKNPNDDLEDIFSEEARRHVSDSKIDEKERSRAIKEHQELIKSLDSCDKCFDSPKMEKQLIVAMGSKVYLSIPNHEGLQIGHCTIAPIQHISCSTLLDEDVWEEIQNFQKALIRMFSSHTKDCIFFETARYLHKRPHMVIHCIPSKDFELAPFYFKKAIQESEAEWAHNKQLIDLKKEKKSLRRAIPKGLPYFWVSFADGSGFAHVIEDQNRFPSNFAQEIIGGLLNLNPRLWRHPKKEYNLIPKVKQFADWWKPFDITN